MRKHVGKSVNILRRYLRPFRPYIERAVRGARLLTRSKFWYERGSVSGIECYGIPGRHVFYGYYDRSPASGDGQWLLAHSAPPGLGADGRAEFADVGVFRRGLPGVFHSLGRTKAWNWQQGSRLMWFPGEKGRAIFNCIEDGVPYAAVVEVPGGNEVGRFGFPIYDVSSDGKWAIGLDFARLHRLRRGYGYAAMTDKSEGCLVPTDDGVRLYRLDQPEKPPVILTVAKLAVLEPVTWSKESEHYINHLSFSPCGKWIFLIHLWTHKGIRRGRSIICSADLNQVRPLEPHSPVSHFAWQPDGNLLLYLVSGRKGSYKRFDPQTLKELDPLMNGAWEDGHPTVSTDGKNVIVDVYPDWMGDRALYLVSTESKRIRKIAKSYSPYSLTGDQRCDLHPRWVDSQSIAVDSAHAQLRQLCIVNLVNGATS